MHEVSLHPRCNQSTKTQIISWDLEHRNPPVNLSWPHLFVETRRFDLMHSWQLLVFGVYLLSLLERPNTPDAHGGASKIKILTPQKRYKSFLLCCSVCNWLCSPRVCVERGRQAVFKMYRYFLYSVFRLFLPAATSKDSLALHLSDGSAGWFLEHPSFPVSS